MISTDFSFDEDVPENAKDGAREAFGILKNAASPAKMFANVSRRGREAQKKKKKKRKKSRKRRNEIAKRCLASGAIVTGRVLREKRIKNRSAVCLPRQSIS